jgi:transposase InsO family protein
MVERIAIVGTAISGLTIAYLLPRRHELLVCEADDYIGEKFPFRIHTVRTDRGHKWQAQFDWHVEDKGITHVYITPRSSQLNGKGERSHRTDQESFTSC